MSTCPRGATATSACWRTSSPTAGNIRRGGRSVTTREESVEQLRDLMHRALGIGRSPYEYELEAGRPFESYGMEQQAQIVEDSFRA